MILTDPDFVELNKIKMNNSGLTFDQYVTFKNELTTIKFGLT